MDKKIGLFGLLSHAAMVAAFLLVRYLRGDRFGADLVLIAVPLLLLSAFLVYAAVVSRYVQKREGMQRTVIIDSLVGILAEFIIVTLAALLAGLVDGVRASVGTGAGLGEQVLASVLMSLLWVYATLLVQVIVVGNLCGLAGWFLLRNRQPGR